jgi:hypothetical protein
VYCFECRHASEKKSAESSSQPENFVPPADSAISPARMTSWFNCNPGLDSVSGFFTKSLTADNAALTYIMLKKFSLAQNRVCIDNGLPGGYKEYQWIMEHFGSKKNKAVYDSLKSCWKK